MAGLPPKSDGLEGYPMKLICDRLSLSDALTMASGVVASRTPSPVLLCLKLVAKKSSAGGTLQISATDSEIGLVVTVPNVDIKEEGEALIPADKLNQIVRACDDSTVSISVDRTLATITTENSMFKVFGYEPREFPGVRKPVSPLRATIRATPSVACWLIARSRSCALLQPMAVASRWRVAPARAATMIRHSSCPRRR
jgi:hypothetical protein